MCRLTFAITAVLMLASTASAGDIILSNNTLFLNNGTSTIDVPFVNITAPDGFSEAFPAHIDFTFIQNSMLIGVNIETNITNFTENNESSFTFDAQSKVQVTILGGENSMQSNKTLPTNRTELINMVAEGYFGEGATPWLTLTETMELIGVQ